MFTIPSTLYKKLGGFLAIPVLLVTVFAVIMIGRVHFRSGFSLFLPPNDPYRQIEDHVTETFGQTDLIIVALDVERVLEPKDLDRIQELTVQAQEVPGTASVVSLTNLEDLYLVDGVLEQRPIYRPDRDATGEELARRVLETPLFTTLFVSQDRKAIYTYVSPTREVIPAEYGRLLMDKLDAPDVHFFGDAIAKAYVSTAVMEELILLGALALAIVLVVEIIISRSIIVGLLLGAVSMVPAMWTLALFPLLGNAVETTTMMVPVIVLVLATSYGIHIYRYHALGLGDMAGTLQSVSSIVLSAGFTTILGFLSLLVTPSRILTQLGTLIIFGVAAALITSFALLPPLLDPLTKRIRDRARRPADRVGSDAPDPDRKARSGHRFAGVMRWLQRPARRPAARLAIGAVLICALGAFIPTVHSGYSARDTFRDGTEIADAVAYFQERAGATHDIDLYVDTGQEYGLVYLDSYNKLREIESQLVADPLVSRSLSYIDFVEFMLGRLQGSTQPIRPQSDSEVGEAMELLSGGTIGLTFDALVDTAWKETRLLLQVNFPPITDPEGVAAVETLLRDTRSAFGASTDLWTAAGRREVGFDPPGLAQAAVIGVPIENLQHIRYLTRSQVISLLAFAPIIVAFLILVFKSLRWALLSLAPTVVGVVVYFGILGASRFLHDPIHVFMVAALMGIANDDVLYFILVFRRERAVSNFSDALAETVHKTGAAIIQTTLILIAGIATFYFSRFILLGRAGFVVTLGLLAATATTLILVPSIIQLNGPMRRHGRARRSSRAPDASHGTAAQ